MKSQKKYKKFILGITPARGGSKIIPRKNIKKIYGKPLIAWTIDAAKKSKVLDRYIVSTEDREIANISHRFGAEVLDRPKQLAGDSATTLSVLKDIIDKIDCDIVVLLQCTSPVRENGLIDKCVKKFLDSKADSLATGFMCNLFEWGTYSARRQDLDVFFHDDGSVYVLKADLIKKAKKWGDVWGKKKQTILTDKEQNFEIDDAFDFWVNEQILKKRAKQK